MPKQPKKDKEEPTADEMAAPPAEQPVEVPDDIPEPPARQEHPDAPILKADTMRGEVITIIDGAVFLSRFTSEEEEKRRAVIVFKGEEAITYKDDDGEKHTLEAGEVGKFFTSSKRVVYAMDHWATEAEPFAVAKKVKVIVDPQSRGKGIKFVAP